MWSKFTAWLLAAITALFNNLGFWQQPNEAYVGDPGYAIQADEVDYNAMHKWYDNLYGDSASSCKVQARNHKAEVSVSGVAFIVADAKLNPDAQLKFSDEDIIVAPGRCKVKTEPTTSSSKIVVQNDEKGARGFKIEIINPKRWFCCEDLSPSATGQFYHSQDTHKIELQQGDTICVASSDTEVTLFRGEGRNGELKKCDLRTFLLASEEGNSDVNVNGSDVQIITNTQGKEDALCTADIDPSDIYTGPSGWKKDSTGWWWGTSGEPKVNYASDQYIVYEQMYYYFNPAGYMVTGWYDGHYYQPSATAHSEGISDFKQGAMCFNTIVPSEDGSKYVYLNNAGDVETPSQQNSYRVSEGVAYSYNSSIDGYEISYGAASQPGSGNSTDMGNNQGGQNIGSQENKNGKLSKEQYEQLTENDGGVDRNMSGWYEYRGNWLLLEGGYPMSGDADCRLGSKHGNNVERVTYNNKVYFFDIDTHVLIRGSSSGENPVYICDPGNFDAWYIIDRDQGAAMNKWWQDSNGRWLYASATGVLYQEGIDNGASASGVYKDPSGVQNRFYAFDENCYLDETTPSVYADHNGARFEYYLDRQVAGSRGRRN